MDSTFIISSYQKHNRTQSQVHFQGSRKRSILADIETTQRDSIWLVWPNGLKTSLKDEENEEEKIRSRIRWEKYWPNS